MYYNYWWNFINFTRNFGTSGWSYINFEAFWWDSWIGLEKLWPISGYWAIERWYIYAKLYIWYYWRSKRCNVKIINGCLNYSFCKLKIESQFFGRKWYLHFLFTCCSFLWISFVWIFVDLWNEMWILQWWSIKNGWIRFTYSLTNIFSFCSKII